MKNLIVSISLIITMLGFSTNNYAKDRKYDSSKTYQLKQFSKVDIEGGFKITLIQSNKNSLIVETSNENVFEDMRVEVNHDKLKIWLDRETINLNTTKIHLILTFQDINEIELGGGIKLKSKGYLEFDDLELSVEGGAKINMKLTANNFSAHGEGGVLLNFDGIANKFLVELEGAGKVNAFDLKAKKVEVRIAGIGFANVYAEEKLDVLLEGAGKINYKGTPIINQQIDGLGKVSKY